MIDTSVFIGKKATYYTLGCKLNYSETSTLRAMLGDLGVVDTKPDKDVDLCLINTCSVTAVADHKSQQIIHRLVRTCPKACIVVAGCFAQLAPHKLANINGVDLVLGVSEKGKLLQYLSDLWTKNIVEDQSNSRSADVFITNTNNLRAFTPACSKGNRTRYFLKVQDGCDRFCTYCTIPMARGRSRNAPIDALVAQAKYVVAQGGCEIVLTGVNIGDFGKTTGETFLQLIERLDKTEGLCRLRLGSIEPDLLSDPLIDFCASARTVMPHFHIPLQSGSDNILKLMHRKYDTQFFAEKISKIRKTIPKAFIGVDVMVGSRGETQNDFEQSMAFIEMLDISRLHVFPYSERPKTAALNIPYVVNEKEKRERCHKLITLSGTKMQQFYRRFIGTRAEVLLEKKTKGGEMSGYTDNYLRVEIPAEQTVDIQNNTIVDVILEKINDKGDSLIANKVERLKQYF